MFKKKIISMVKKRISNKDMDNYIEEIGKPELGDYALPCFFLSKEYKESPALIAKKLASKIKPNKYIVKIQNVGPYLNFFINKELFAKKILTKIITQKKGYGSNKSGLNKKALIEHTSINPNASPHIGRARNAMIGDVIARMFRFEGYEIKVHYFVNDIGKQIAMLVLGSQNKKISFKKLLKIYVDINKKIETNPELEKKIFGLLKRLELGDEKVKKQFKKVVDICIKGQSKIFDKLKINFDFYDYESKYLFNNKTKKIIKKLEQSGKVFCDENGRKVLDLTGYSIPTKSPVLVLTRKDGTSLYVVRDLAYTLDKIKIAKNRNLIVLGEDHKTYFEQLKIALSLLNKKCPYPIYYSYVILKGEGKMSTRKGYVVLLEYIMEEAEKKARAEIKKRHGNISDLDKRAKIIAFGATRYTILKVSSDKNVCFDINKALSFEGDSAPYIQYAYARASSILKKSKLNPKNIDFSLLNSPEEVKLIKALYNFQKVFQKALESYQPHLIANYVLELATLFNEFYHLCPILSQELEIKKARLYLLKAVKQVLKNALNLLGIQTLERM
ncbi:MAG: arginine--tRNA ligase [Nanoarchaeota archaeon]|nr:arginine--tRNA ligase [Nanoarchaeota archaeon]